MPMHKQVHHLDETLLKNLKNKNVMNKKISKLLEDLITECECDNRIETGIFDIYNTEHLVVLSEHMTSHGISESVIEDAIQSMVDEGKYPERQAYNKEGWLVTFPSKEYRDAAIKKKTHFSSDPTHGKGGMNLYYKKKGKQKRQTTQGVSTTGKSQAQQPSTPKAPAPAPDQDIVRSRRTPEQEAEFQKRLQAQDISPSRDDADFLDFIASREPGAKKDTKQQPVATQSDQQPVEKPVAKPAIDVPVLTQPPEQYATVSKKFAIQKGWKAAEYGEYHDLEGNPIAVVGLSGEIVPIRSNDREEYKIFAEKNMPS